MSRRFLISICLLLLVTACGAIRLPAELDIIVLNKSGRKLTETRVRFGDYVCKWGVVVKDADKGFLFYPHPITPDADFLWNDEAEKEHKIKVDLRGIYPPRASGRLTFVFYGDRVVAEFKKR